ncbi:hypothetical protein HOD20_06035 [archaeon]|jgi:hypothetical protein|nr:hypothetical protein [archaeon]MBT4647174.1 hypothetical protein [archaeon]MBT6822177.1 hypothetical protein [archaeon]MBT7391748.1 hypothetical protein [archaeon]
MKKIIILILSIVLMSALILSCSKQTEPVGIEGSHDNEIVTQPIEPEVPDVDNTITGDISEVDSLEENLDEEVVDTNMEEVDDLINNW